MEVQIKRAVKAGNSSAVILPRAWLNKEVRIELVRKTPETILCDILGILNKYINLDEIIGIYLTGSYARREEDEKSDIDILIITRDKDMELINEGIYNILIVSAELLGQKLKKDLFPVGQMIKEAKPLLNSAFLNSIEINITRENTKWYLDSTGEKLEMIEKIINKMKKNNKKLADDRVVYTLILRLKTLYIIKNLIENKAYSKKEFISKIRKISGGSEAYERYLAVKNNQKAEQKTDLEEAEKLKVYLKNMLIGIKKKISS